MSHYLAIIDDHTLFRKGLVSLIDSLDEKYEIIFEASNGQEMIQKINAGLIANLILMDITMPRMDGFQSVEWLRKNFPEINIIVISMIEKEESIVNMLKLGVKGYLSKDVESAVLSEALRVVSKNQYYYTDFITGKLIHSLITDTTESKKIEFINSSINLREREFLKLACSDLTYNEIASALFVSPKTVDGYRAGLFEKCNVKSRVGLAVFAIKFGIVKLD